MKKLLFLSASLIIIISCKKTIHLNLADESGNIVIEGNISNIAPSYYVRISRSVAFTQPNLYPSVTGATVVITDNSGQRDSLQYRAADSCYHTTHLAAIPGNTYTLNVSAGGVDYTAQSTMPYPVTLDSLRQDSILLGGKTLYGVIPAYTDPDTLGNYYRFKLYLNGALNYGFTTTSDVVNNGMANIRPLYANNPDNNDSDKIQMGDTVTIELQCIDAAVYTYFVALAQNDNVTPANPPTNISNGALGIFSAHTSSWAKMVIK